MDAGEGSAAVHHISGLYTMMLTEALTERLPANEVADVLARAGEVRSLSELSRPSSWSSYDQFKRLLEESKVAMGSHFGTRVNLVEFVTQSHTEITAAIQSLGSPGNVLANTTGTNALVPIRRYATTEIAPNEWTISERFLDAFAPYREYCEFAAGQYALIPLFFGLPPADVVEEACQCRGDASCVFRIRWEPVDQAHSRVEYLEMHTRVLEARLDQLQEMVTDLASNERYEDVLRGIVTSSMRSVGASGALLALEPRQGAPWRIYSEGLTEAEAEGLAREHLAGQARPGSPGAVDVVSARRRYGILAISERGVVFNAQSHSTLETYGRLAAATLDAADAMDEARHQANTARTLLELSTSLSEIVSPAEMAAKVARAVPAVVECDCAAIFLDDGDYHATGDISFRLAACFGYSDDVIATLSAQTHFGAPADQVVEMGIVQASWPETGTVRTISAPINVAGKVIGAVMAGVLARPERLTITPRIADRLTGLAAQASIALTNARLVEQIRHQAVHDTLTGLPNRALLLDRTEQMLARARRAYVPVAALFIDLDGFKEINDTLGHAVGDQLLQAVAARLAATMRESDSVGRLGGDEFVVLVDGSTMDAGPELVAERLLSVLRTPFELEGCERGPLHLTASIGIAAGARASATELLRDADIALYGAKDAGKDCFMVFRPEMHTVVQDRLLMEMDLRDALAEQQYFLVYQPIFDLASGAPTGVEVLLRWRHPIRGVVEPDDFIPLLERSGRIHDVGRWVLTEACRQGARWHGLGYQLDVSVNISARQLETDELIRDVSRALCDAGFDARSLIVELTETAIMRNTPDVVRRLTALKSMGVRVAIDDFGTGYSSLAHLRQFPVDTIKIDRSFIASMADSPEAGVLIRSLVQLGKTLGLETLAEGIEATGQYAQLAREHCDGGQGYLFGRPLETDAVEHFLAARAAAGVGTRGGVGPAPVAVPSLGHPPHSL